MRNKRKLIIAQLNQKLQTFSESREIPIPERGWIHTIRTALNMTMAQLGNKLNITRQGVKRLEDSEAHGTITLNSLKDVAKAMDLKLVYALVPIHGTIDELIELKANDLARKIVSRTNQTMALENQAIGDEKIAESIKELAEEIKREMRKSLWD